MNKYRISITGAAGRMGMIYAPLLIEQGHEVRVYDRSLGKLESLYGNTKATLCNNNKDLVKDADIVLLLTPVPETRDVLIEMKDYLPPHAIISSAASSKERIAEAELEFAPHGARIVDFHPMHGENKPGGTFPKDQNILTVPVLDYEINNLGETAEDILKGLFIPMGAKVKHIDNPTKHDEIMGDVQGGNHGVSKFMSGGWRFAGTDPDRSETYANPLDDMKSLFGRRPLALNLDVYVVTMLWNRFVSSYVKEYADILSEMQRLAIIGERKKLYKMAEETKEHYGLNEIKDARDRLASVYGKNLDDTTNSHISIFVWGEVDKRRNKRPADFIEFESPHYAMGRILRYAVFGGDLKRFADNAIDNPETKWQDYCYGMSVSVINQIVQGGIRNGNPEALLTHLQILREYFNKDMKRNLDKIAIDSTELSRKLREN